jgi:hypothetical protein
LQRWQTIRRFLFFSDAATGCSPDPKWKRKERTTFPALTLNSSRAAAVESFQRLHLRGRFGLLWNALHNDDRHLKDFAASAPLRRESRKYLGLREIQVGQITGSLGRGRDFDPAFRPLKSHLRDRWVSVYLLAGNGGWEPVRLHKLGEDYYVEDGHHRVSVARQQGMAYVRAEVWEYVLQPCQPPTCVQPPRRGHFHPARSVPACG